MAAITKGNTYERGHVGLGKGKHNVLQGMAGSNRYNKGRRKLQVEEKHKTGRYRCGQQVRTERRHKVSTHHFGRAGYNHDTADRWHMNSNDARLYNNDDTQTHAIANASAL